MALKETLEASDSKINILALNNYLFLVYNLKPINKEIAKWLLFLLHYMCLCEFVHRQKHCARSFHLCERYLWWFTPELPQEMLTTWNNSPLLPPPWAINRVKICKCFPLQRWEEEASLEHQDGSTWSHGGMTTWGNSETYWNISGHKNVLS